MVPYAARRKALHQAGTGLGLGCLDGAGGGCVCLHSKAQVLRQDTCARQAGKTPQCSVSEGGERGERCCLAGSMCDIVQERNGPWQACQHAVVLSLPTCGEPSKDRGGVKRQRVVRGQSHASRPFATPTACAHHSGMPSRA